MLEKVAAVGLLLVTLMGSVPELPTRTCPKSRETGERTRVGGVAVPKRLMKSSALEESEVISRALMTLLMVWDEEACGVKARATGQLAPGTRMGQEPATVKSGVVVRPVTWIVAVPVLAKVTVCGAEALPPEVAAKVSELCKTV